MAWACKAAVAGLLLGAATGLAVGREISQYALRIWDVRKGLPEERINGIAQTADRQLWLATNAGLVRFDGRSFQVFRPGPELGRFAGVFMHIAAVDGNALLLLTVDQDVLRFDGEAFRLLRRLKGPASACGFARSMDGALRIASTKRVYEYRDGEIRDALGPRLAAGESLACLAPSLTAPDAWWVGTSQGRIGRMSPDGGITFRIPFEAPGLTMLAETAPGHLLAGTRTGLLELTESAMRRVEAAVPVTTAQRWDGAVWVGSKRGMLRGQEGEWTGFPPDLLQADGVQSSIVDAEGSLWFSQIRGQLVQVRAPKFQAWGWREGLQAGFVTAVLAAGERVFFASDSGIGELSGNRVRNIPGRVDRVRVLALDPRGNLWIGGHGLYRLDGPRFGQVRRVGGPEFETVHWLHWARDGRLWILSMQGVYIYAEGRFRQVPGFPHLNRRSRMIEDANGTLWLSAPGTGLFEIREEAPVQRFQDVAYLQRIHTMYEGSGGVLWIGLDGGGLARLQNGVLKRHDVAPEDHLNRVYAIAEDRVGNLWLGLRNQLLMAPRDRILSAPDGSQALAGVRTFGIADELRSVNFGLAWTCANTPGAETIYFAHLQGLVGIPARGIPSNPAPPKVIVRRVWSSQRDYPVVNGSVEVPAGAGEIRIRTVAPSFVHPEGTQFRSQLEGFETEWKSWTAGEDATFTNLPPGDYRFLVTPRNSDQVTGETVGIRLHKQAYFYQEVWFRGLLFVLSLAALVGLVRFRTRLLQNRNEELQARVQERTAELEAAKNNAERATQAKADFLATMSHEIRTPMHGVLGTLDLLASTRLDGEQQEHVDTIRRSGRALLTLLNDILDLSKLEAGGMQLHPSPFSLPRTIEEVIRPLEATALQKGTRIHLLVETPLPSAFLGDEARLRQVLFNLIGNAVKFTDLGKVTVTVGAERQPSNFWRVTIAVTDTGIGIPEAGLRDLFQKFYQVDGSFRRRFGGTGLGLAICRKLMTLMDGTIEVSSQEGAGSTFRIQLSMPEGEAEAGHESQAPETRENLRACVLVVEDNAVNRKVAQKMLTQLGCAVEVAVNGLEAVRKAQERTYDLIFMDCQMPEMDGFEATEELRRLLGPQCPPIVAMTANAMAEDRDRCHQAGMNGYLAKPFTVDELANAIRKYAPHKAGEGPEVAGGTQRSGPH